jgi:hypothetical protein
MDMEKFKQDLDELFRLFNKLMEKQEHSMDDIPGLNKAMLQQFKFFFSNYATMKDQIAYQLQGQFGEGVQEMVQTLIQQLREELGESVFEVMEEPEAPASLQIQPQPDNPSKEIAEIDEMLKNPNLSQAEIDALLDRRSQLS